MDGRSAPRSRIIGSSHGFVSIQVMLHPFQWLHTFCWKGCMLRFAVDFVFCVCLDCMMNTYSFWILTLLLCVFIVALLWYRWCHWCQPRIVHEQQQTDIAVEYRCTKNVRRPVVCNLEVMDGPILPQNKFDLRTLQNSINPPLFAIQSPIDRTRKITFLSVEQIENRTRRWVLIAWKI